MTHLDDPACAAIPLDASAERALRQGRELREMAAIGLRLLRQLETLAVSETPPAPAEISLAYHRYTRAVRLTHAAENRVADEQTHRDRNDPDRQNARIQAKLAAAMAATSRPDRRRDVLRNVVPDMIAAAAEREPMLDTDRLYRDYETTIDDEISDAEIEGKPITELIALICEGLDIVPDWKLWRPDDWTDDYWSLDEAERIAVPPVDPPPRAPDEPALAVLAELIRPTAQPPPDP